MEDELGDHVPWYPDVRDEDYNAQLNSKAEYQLHAQSQKQQNAIFFNRQRLTQIHLGPQTPNDSLLVYEDTGLGKTCNAIGIAETRHEWLGQYLNTNNPMFKEATMNKALVIAQNKTSLADNFKQDIISTCTAGAYLTENLAKQAHRTERGKVGAQTKSTKASYELHTQKKFAGMIEKMTPEQIAIRFSFRVIILDEAHMYRAITKTVGEDEYGDPVTMGGKVNYDMIMKLLDNVYGCIIVALTATPVVNDINEFPSIINLILNKANRVNPEHFASLASQGSLEDIKRSMEEYLIPKLRGKIFRTKQSRSISKSIVRTNEDPQNPLLPGSTRLYLARITNNNGDYIDYTDIINSYMQAFQADVGTKQTQFYTNMNFASSMIWPEGLIRGAAFDRFLIKDEDGYKFSEDFKCDFRFQMHQARTRLIAFIQQDIDRFRAAGQGDSPQAKIKEVVLAALQKRISAFLPMDLNRDNFDHNNIDDLRTMVYVVRSRYSPVFANILEIIMGIEVKNKQTGQYEYIYTPTTNSFNTREFDPRDLDNRECAYIYNNYKPGGIFPFGLLLEYFGYEQLKLTTGSYINSKENRITGLTRAKRYALLYSSEDSGGTGEIGKITDAKMRKVLQLANHPDNRYGHYLKVVFGTDVTAQGINFRNIRQAHLSSRKWNEAGNIQAEGRVDRNNSQKAFSTDDPVPVLKGFVHSDGTREDVRYGVAVLNGIETQRYVKVFRHVAFFEDVNGTFPDGSQTNLSIGIKMYKDAIQKELKNSIPTDIMERIAANRLLSLQPDDVLPGRLIGYSGDYKTDYVTYNLFYAQKEIEDLKCRIRGHFKTNIVLRLEDIVKLCVGSHRSTVIKALTEMVNTNERLIDRHGLLNYLREHHDVFFLQKTLRSLRSNSEQWLAYYSAHNFVKESESIEDLYDRFEYSKIENLLNFIRTVSVDNYSQIITRIDNLSYRSRGFLVETLVKQSVELRRAGKISPDALGFIFEKLDPYVMFFPGNNLIVHVFGIKSKQLAKNRATQMKIAETSRGELRVFALNEGNWRNSKYIEDLRYISLINDHAEELLFAHMEKFSHYGTSTIVDGLHIFRVQDKLHKQATSSVTKKGNLRKQGADSGGREAFGLQVPVQKWHLYHVIIDLHVLINIYKPIYVRNIIVQPMLIMRLVKSDTGVITCGSFKFNLDIDPKSIKTPAFPQGVPHLVTNHQDLAINANNYELVASTCINYRHAYPEIIGLIYNRELAGLDLNLANPSNQYFYPSMKKNAKGVRVYFPTVPPLPPGVFRYSNVLDILPVKNQDKCEDLQCKLLGTSNDQAGMMILDDLRYISVNSDGLIFKAMNGLYSELMNQNGYEGIYIEKHPHSANKALGLMIDFPVRFSTVWPLNKDELIPLIYLLYYLQGSILKR